MTDSNNDDGTHSCEKVVISHSKEEVVARNFKSGKIQDFCLS